MTGSGTEVPELDHAAIGNGRVIALVSPSSAIDWLCLPRFDSPSVFARLLDREHGGTFRFLARDAEFEGACAYVPNTNVVRTEFHTADGTFEVFDFAPRLPRDLDFDVPIEIVRLVVPTAGSPVLTVDFDPKPDYARAHAECVLGTDGIEVHGADQLLVLYTNLPGPYVLEHRPFVLAEPLYFVLSHGRRDRAPTLASVRHDLDATIAGWRAWAKTCALPMFAAAEVLRSALCLKLHACHDTGAIIAAATTSIPEALGTERTWDYRYCWLRDAAFVVEALRRLSQLSEGERLMRFLRDVVESGPLQPLYGLAGERELPEQVLGHLAGFAGNGPVRIGNAAALQVQNDLMGEIILCLETMLSDPRIVHEDPRSFFPAVRKLVEQALAVAREPDTGIWEYRAQLRPYTFSRAMCWAAAHRGAVIARRFGEVELARRWDHEAGLLRAEVLEQGYNAELGFFTQALGGRNPDASNLLLPSLGLLDARDQRFVSTVDAYAERLVVNGMMLRYRHDDDFGKTTSAFTICSFWWAEALAMMGRLDDAIEVFQRVVSHQNPLGLFSEDVDPSSGRLLGNFPQAYTHVGLVHAAMTIGELLDARDGRVRAWT
ncbi:MAG: glycoside hydrolase family 15 protein [Planctomycetes bacterium]|nr:glycoside hydrolase family 15 protein [Planctomycetota bacterium]